MPELPEVETIKRELEKKIIGKKITGVIVHHPAVVRHADKNDFIRSSTGAVIKNILRRGKLLILELSNGKSLAIHLKMTGQLIYPGEGRSSRVSFKLSDGKFLDFKDQRLFGELKAVDDWKELEFVKALGPEPFDLNPREFSAMFSSRKTKIKPLLMDQNFLSGIGNLYAAEALFRARINPARPAASLSEKEKSVLFKEIKDTLSEAIEHKGSSVDQYVRLSGERGNYVKYHKVYDREGKPCFACGATIKRTALGGRGTYFCPKCQK